MDTKVCSKCHIEQPATKEYFPSRKQAKDGFHSWCKKCICVAVTGWSKKNKEHVKEYHKKYDRKYCQKYRQTLKGYISHLIDSIKDRCNNSKKSNYKWYGGRGIKCLFTTNELFDWVVANNIEPRGRDIHRINNDSNYTLNNIEFLEHGLHASLHAAIRKQGKR